MKPSPAPVWRAGRVRLAVVPAVVIVLFASTAPAGAAVHTPPIPTPPPYDLGAVGEAGGLGDAAVPFPPFLGDASRVEIVGPGGRVSAGLVPGGFEGRVEGPGGCVAGAVTAEGVVGRIGPCVPDAPHPPPPAPPPPAEQPPEPPATPAPEPPEPPAPPGPAPEVAAPVRTAPEPPVPPAPRPEPPREADRPAPRPGPEPDPPPAEVSLAMAPPRPTPGTAPRESGSLVGRTLLLLAPAVLAAAALRPRGGGPRSPQA
ncbi:hypothetical protein [Streptomyces spiramenti]|uniref:Uncharacterized protein n=1 Tax=Streptomyces spiramenti TaxID=2720606 RepID=A0ABX1ALX6_9ACTN|nr:hypothetical protein [Streptomyces spiramenti]NJP65628.1 hypothetical protein [Streptomyces spiramenti]